MLFTKVYFTGTIEPCLRTCKRIGSRKDNGLVLYELGVQWSLIGGDVVKYQYDHRLPLRADTTQDYAESAPRDETVEAHATHLLATCLQQSTAIAAFEFDGVELILKRQGNTSNEILHELVAASLSYVMGCNVSIWSAQA